MPAAQLCPRVAKVVAKMGLRFSWFSDDVLGQPLYRLFVLDGPAGAPLLVAMTRADGFSLWDMGSTGLPAQEPPVVLARWFASLQSVHSPMAVQPTGQGAQIIYGGAWDGLHRFGWDGSQLSAPALLGFDQPQPRPITAAFVLEAGPLLLSDGVALWQLGGAAPPLALAVSQFAQVSADIGVVADTQTGLLASVALGGDGPVLLASLPPSQQPGFASPADMVALAVGGRNFVVVAGAQSHSLSVFEVLADGALQARDHVIDTGATRFGTVQAVAGASDGVRALVMAAGGDDGASLFQLLPDGRLLHMQTWVHSPGDGLRDIVDIVSIARQDSFEFVLASEDSPALQRLTQDLGQMGAVLAGGAGIVQGGDGDDVLLAYAGAQLLGGAGADSFVFNFGQNATVADFQPGQDQLDLSAFPMLRSISQLQETPLEGGVRLGYFGTEIDIYHVAGQALTLADVLPDGLPWPDRIFTLDTAEIPPPNLPATLSVPQGPPAVAAGLPGVITLREGQETQDLAATALLLRMGTGAPQPIARAEDGSFSLGLGLGQQARVEFQRPVQTGDGAITVGDALAALRLAVGVDQAQDARGMARLLAADINGDGRASVGDALDILRIAVGLSPSTPVAWRYFDADTLQLPFGRNAVPIDTGVAVVGLEAPQELQVIEILTGDVDFFL